ncbi:MAG: HPr family phosphocarrier protein [Bacillota bacterium]
MISKEITIINKLGLHARPAALFVQMTNKYDSDVFLEKGTKKINAKSIMGVMSLGVSKGETVTIITDGPDEQEAMEALVNLIEHVLMDL